jgi:muconolactone delta-isomerase
VIHRDVSRTAFEITHGVATLKHQLTDQLVRLDDNPLGIIDEAALQDFPRFTEPGGFGRRQRHDIETFNAFFARLELRLGLGAAAQVADATAKLADEGHLVRVWRSGAQGETTIVGLYRAESESQLDGLLGSLPLADWLHVTVTPLEAHPNDPAARQPASSNQLPEPRLSLTYRLDATLAHPLDLGDTAQGHRRIVALTGGTFSGPELNGKLLPGASADWQIVLPDGTALGDIRYTLQTEGGELLYVQSRGVRHGSAEFMARLGHGEDVDASEYTFRASTKIETAAAGLEWLNKGVFIGVGARQRGGVIYETYLVG